MMLIGPDGAHRDEICLAAPKRVRQNPRNQNFRTSAAEGKIGPAPALELRPNRRLTMKILPFPGPPAGASLLLAVRLRVLPFLIAGRESISVMALARLVVPRTTTAETGLSCPPPVMSYAATPIPIPCPASMPRGATIGSKVIRSRTIMLTALRSMRPSTSSTVTPPAAIPAPTPIIISSPATGWARSSFRR